MLENINGADQATWEDTFKGIHPHLEKQRYTTVKAALRSESESQDGDITYLATSTQSDGEQTSKATLAVSGWQIQHSNAGISLTHAAKFNPGVGPLPDFIERILVASEAGSPFKVKTFLDKYGHPPFFLRWGPGQARLGEEVRSSDSNLEAGKLAWRISADGPKSSGPQLAWLQWDRKMYRESHREASRPYSMQVALVILNLLHFHYAQQHEVWSSKQTQQTACRSLASMESTTWLRSRLTRSLQATWC